MITVTKEAQIKLTTSHDITIMTYILQAAGIRVHREGTDAFDVGVTPEIASEVINMIAKLEKGLR